MCGVKDGKIKERWQLIKSDNDNGMKIGRKSAFNLDVYEEIALFREHLAVDGFIFIRRTGWGT